MSNTSDIRLIQMNNYVRPKLDENKSKDWVLNGKNNEFYQYIIDRNNGSPTNSAINNSYINLMYGKGLYKKSGSANDWIAFMTMIRPKEIQKIIADFQIFGEASLQKIKAKGKNELPTLAHLPKERVVPQIANEYEEIEGYWYSKDWAKYHETKNKPEYFKAFGTSNDATEIYVIKPYKAGKEYFADPDYLAGLPYAEMEEEISNYYISHIKNGLSFGYIINIPNGNSLTPEEKDEFEKKIKQKLVGSANAGKFVLSFNGVDAEITVTPLQVNDAHKQWQYLTQEARQQLLTSHLCTSSSLVGVNTTSGFSSTADEMDMAESQLIKRVIAPKQNYIIDALEEIARHYDLNLELGFKPLTEQAQTIKTEMSNHVCCSNEKKKSVINADSLIALGEDISEDWEILDERVCEEITLKESDLNTVFEFAQTPKTTNKKDVQDTTLFKIRYRYKGNANGERDFCNKVIQANKVYRSEDLNANYNYNEDFAPSGKSSYNIFLYKGGVNCKHFWQREIYLRKGNDKISVNKARKMILELEPSERKDAQWVQNDKKVAQVAEKQNNYWSLKPNYRG